MIATELVRYLDSLTLVHLQSNRQGPPLRHKAKRPKNDKKGNCYELHDHFSGPTTPTAHPPSKQLEKMIRATVHKYKRSLQAYSLSLRPGTLVEDKRGNLL